MADRFLNSVDGSDSNTGADWNNEKLTMATGIAGIDAAGDRVLINSAHAESASTFSYTCPGTPANPIQFLSVTPTGTSGISALTAGASFTATGSAGMTFAGSYYAKGLSFTYSGNTSAAMSFSVTNDVVTLEDCSFNSTGTGGSGSIALGASGSGAGTRMTVINPTFRIGATGQRVTYAGHTIIRGGQWSASGTLNPGGPFSPAQNGRGQLLEVYDFDFSNLNAAINLIGGFQPGSVAKFYGCRLPASWSGAPVSSTSIQPGQRVEMYNCDNADTNYRLWIRDYHGDIKSETTIVRSGGASDGTTPLSWKMDTTANCAYPNSHLRSPEIAIWNDTSGSSKTVTVEFVHDTNVTAGQGAGTSSAFRDDEVWLEVRYMGDGSYPKTTTITDQVADVITTASDQTSSSVTWTTTGMTTPVKQKLSVTFTPQEKGWFICTVCMAKASKTIYVCPKADVT